MINVLPTRNVEWGFWGTANRNGYDPHLTWQATSDTLATAFDLTRDEVRDLLDARFGRHLADELSFIAGGPTSYELIEEHIMKRVADRGWRKWFEKAIGDLRAVRILN